MKAEPEEPALKKPRKKGPSQETQQGRQEGTPDRRDPQIQSHCNRKGVASILRSCHGRGDHLKEEKESRAGHRKRGAHRRERNMRPRRGKGAHNRQRTRVRAHQSSGRKAATDRAAQMRRRASVQEFRGGASPRRVAEGC